MAASKQRNIAGERRSRGQGPVEMWPDQPARSASPPQFRLREQYRRLSVLRLHRSGVFDDGARFDGRMLRDLVTATILRPTSALTPRRKFPGNVGLLQADCGGYNARNAPNLRTQRRRRAFASTELPVAP